MAPVDAPAPARRAEKVPQYFTSEGNMRVQFLGKDPESEHGQSPTLFATDRADRCTYIVQGWVVTDRQVLAEIGPVPDGEAVIEIPEESSAILPAA
ncbi:hypothetical protein [Amycolatopsis cihanbeyliensis]|nr:hypothetical protein [Amycolatopsis cihanbeyliensis]